VSARLLLDPELLVPPQRPPQEWRDYWSRLVAWSTDRRCGLGPASHAFVYDEYAKLGYPHATLLTYPQELQREYRKAIDRMLSSVYAPTREARPLTFTPRYKGSDGAEAALGRDVSSGVDAVGSSADHWTGQGVHRAWCHPPPPESVELVFVPGMALAAEVTDDARRWFRGRLVKIVGGQPDQRVMSRMEAELGIRVGAIDWFACERHKKPPIGKRWQAMDPGRHVGVCITGRVGHDTSIAAQKRARATGIPYLEVETAGQLFSALVDLARSSGREVG
jgi:hypothetical protein